VLNGLQFCRPDVMLIKKSRDHAQHVLLVTSPGGRGRGISSILRVTIRFILEAPGVALKGHSHVMKDICPNQTCVIWSVGSLAREVHFVELENFAHENGIGQRIIG